ncbi:MAG TPA: hypothetical protein VI336_00290 [Candidatus Saccharimonadales bacterium]|nr:hypothetical protein [Candidatus Saccharimonadales bacterium]
MNLNVNPLESTWARFYFELHASAERLREMMRNTPTDSANLAERESAGAEANQPKAGELFDSMPRLELVQKVEVTPQ